MALITVSEQDLSNADAFLTAYLSEKVPEADFSQGGVIRDFVITAIAHIFAFLEGERKQAKSEQSLLALSTQAESQSVSDAVNALLSNWFITRKTGEVARLTATLHFSAAVDVVLSPATRFYRTESLVFTPDISSATVIPASSMVPSFNSNNVVTDYAVTVPLVSEDVGITYNLPPGRFLQTDQFNPFFTYAENQSAVRGGKDVESTAELLVRAPTALTVRNLINVRSIDTVLREEFPGITRVLPLGYGDPEMIRDLATENVSQLRMHTGGHKDVYIQLPVTEVVETGVIGAPYTRPDGLVTQLKDSSPGVDFTAGVPITTGHVVLISAGLADVPREYIVVGVAPNVLTISPRAAFSQATEELVPPGYVTYSVGRFLPNFADLRAPVSTGQTSRALQKANTVVLRGRPHYRVKKVEVYPTATPTAITEHSSRVNAAPTGLEYRVTNGSPGLAQSAFTTDLVEVAGYATGGPWTMRVTYDTLVGYADVQAFVVEPQRRVLAANPLVKGYNPVYITVSIAYKLRIGSTTTLDHVAASASLAEFINNFDLTRTLDLTGMLQHVRDTFPQIGAIISPVGLVYRLYAPDGQVYSYASKDIVTVFPTFPSNNAQLTNGTVGYPAQLEVPIANTILDPTVTGNEPLLAAANASIAAQLSLLGVSDRTLIYLTTPEDVTFTQVT